MTDIIEFAKENLGITLRPDQALVLKSYYGISLRSEERASLENLRNKGKTNCSYFNWEPYGHLEVHMERGEGLTTLLNIITLYEFYSLISSEDPQKDLGLLPNSPIAIFILSNSYEGARLHLSSLQYMLKESKGFFQENLVIGKESITEEEKNITIYAKSLNSPIRGYNIHLAILNETERNKEAQDILIEQRLRAKKVVFGFSKETPKTKAILKFDF